MDTLAKNLGQLDHVVKDLASRVDNGLRDLSDEVDGVSQRVRVGAESDLSIPFFRGDLTGMDFKSWIENFITVCNARLIDDDLKMKVLPAYLKDHAKDAFDQLTTAQRKKFSDMCTALENYLSTPEWTMYHEAVLEQRRQLPGESVFGYLKAIKRACRSIYPNQNDDAYERKIINRFFGGLRSQDIKLEVFRDMPKTLKEAEGLAQRIDMQNILCGPNNNWQGPNKVNTISAHDDTIQKLTRSVELLTTNQKELSRRLKQQGRTEPYNQRNFQKNPNFMNEQRSSNNAALSSFRPNPNYRSEISSKGPRCFRCGKMGHMAMGCLLRGTQPPRPPKESFSC